jgi:hypothetical protein
MTTGAEGAADAPGAASAVGEASELDEASVGEASVGEALGAAGAGGERAVCAPNNVGFHQTTRNATARPTTTALTKKLTRTRVFCN